jgi:hypothetical protein
MDGSSTGCVTRPVRCPWPLPRRPWSKTLVSQAWCFWRTATVGVRVCMCSAPVILDATVVLSLFGGHIEPLID